MTLTHTSVHVSRRHLLGSAGTALALMLTATSAPAQVATVQATGDRVVVNHQAMPVGTTVANSDGGAAPQSAGPIDRATFTSRDNSKAAGATGNRADLLIGPDDLGGDLYRGDTKLIVRSAGVSAAGGAVIASRQDLGAATSRATSTGASYGLRADAVSDSAITISGNTADASATGNKMSSAVALESVPARAGAGIATMQTGNGSNVLASARDQVGTAAGQVDRSTLAISDTLVRAVATGNSMSNRLSSDVTGIEAQDAPGYASIVTFDDAGTAVVTGTLGILSNQVAGGSVRAGAGNGSATYGTIVDGAVAGSSLTTKDNQLVAAAYGNMSANALDVATTSIGGAPGTEGAASGAVAAVTGVQRIADGTTIAATGTSGAATDVAGDVTDSTLSVSGTSARTLAAGNVAAGNALSVSAATIDAQGGSGGIDRLGSAVVGSGGARLDAALGVQNVQDYGDAAVSAVRTGTTAALSVGGTTRSSALRADGNIDLVGATGNDATNRAELDAASVRTTLALNSLQSGEGDVTTALGTASGRGGSLIAAAGPIAGSSLSVTGNGLSGTAIGQTAINGLTIEAGTVADATGGPATSGILPASSQGAAGTFALASNQKLGQPSFGATSTPAISSTLFGGFGATGTAPLSASSISVDDNTQHASALGNSALNRITVSATPGGGAAPVPGTALFASQFGQARISAASDLLLSVPDALPSSSGSVSRNANTAFAVVNDVDNGVTVSGLGGDRDSLGVVSLDATSVPQATGDVAVTNQQVAWGSAEAVAKTQIGLGGTLDRSRLTAADNVTSAEAAGNRALNDVAAVADAGGAGVALANKQTNNFAQVSASATTELAGSTMGSAATDAALSLTGNSISALARGNAVVNALTLAGGMSSTPASAGTTPPTLSATGAAALLNTQTNYGAVLATAAFTAPLDGGGAVRASRIDQSGNAVQANAYGNAATTTVALSGPAGAPGASLASYQANYAPVSAQATGSAFRSAGPISASRLAITGNQLSALATGNQAATTIGLAR